MKLSNAKAAFKGFISSIDGDTRFLSRITAIGLTPGCAIEVMQNEKKQPMLIYSRDTLIAVNRKDCERIEVSEIG